MTETDPHSATLPSVDASGERARSALGPGQSIVQRIPPPARIAAFSLVLIGTAVVMYTAVLAAQPQPALPSIPVPWWLVAAGFALAEVRTVDVHFRREKHSYSLSEVPAVMGMYLLAPSEYFVAMLVGFGAALLWVRTSPLKLAFNLANFAFMGVAMMSAFYVVGGAVGEPGVRSWIGAFAGTSLAAILSALTIAAVISMSGGASQFEKLAEMVQFGQLVSIANTSLGLLAVSILWLDPTLLALLVVPLGAVFLAYRAYGSEKEKHQRLELLYQSSRILQHSPELDSTLGALLEHAREMFRAERAELLLWPRDEDVDGLLTAACHDRSTTTMVPTAVSGAAPLHARVGRERHPFLQVGGGGVSEVRQAMAVPLLGEAGLIGSMVVVNRLTEGTTFGDDDLRLLETLANQAAVALENGQLEQSLSELSRLKEELRYQAYHDPLTGLANRTLFADEVDAALGGASGQRIPVVLFLDLDNFKDVNDSLGHAAGDRLLAAVGERLRSCLRQDDIAARLGGDEFAILLLDEPQLRDALGIATRLIESLAVSFPIQGQDLTISASIGVAACQDHGMAADELLRNADVAMYTAKQGGKNRLSVFEPTMHAAIVARHALTTELSRGINDGEIDVYYQPVVSLATGQAYGAEALARWHHPTRGLIGPDDFIPLAEESGAIIPLGRAVLFEACREAATWPGGLVPPVVTVNLAATQLAQDSFVAEVVDILRATGLPPSRLVLEMTETAMFQDTQTTIARLGALRGLGVRVAIDDFGTGYSSLGYLRRFPVDILKIAREFVAPDEAWSDGWALAHAIVALGQTLGLRIVAEGIEDESQLVQLQRLGCELGQGFLFARPMPGDAAAKWFAEHAPARRRRAALPRELAISSEAG